MLFLHQSSKIHPNPFHLNGFIFAESNNLSEFIIEMNRCNKINNLFDKNSFGVVNEEYVNKIISDVEIILDSRLVKFIRDSLKMHLKHS